MSGSPYKKFKGMKKSWVGFTNISKLEPNMAYKILDIKATNHLEYGPGQQATIEAHDGRKWRTQLPGKYLASLETTEIETIKADIAAGKAIFLVFRERMIDNSYRIDVNEGDEDWISKYKKHEAIPELEDSIEVKEEDKDDKGLEVTNNLKLDEVGSKTDGDSAQVD